MCAPSFLITHARVFDSLHERVTACSVLVLQGRIAALGEAAVLAPMLPPGARTMDLGGRLLLPGFVDGHVHLLGLGLRLVGDRLDLTGTRSLAEALDAVDRYAESLPADEWVRGGGWDWNSWPEGRSPSAADLDGRAGGRPVALTSRCGHSMWLNSPALALLGVDARTPDPPGGVIGRDSAGNPDGLLHDGAMELVREGRPTIGLRRREEALLAAIEYAYQYGLVGCHNCEGPETFAPLLELQREGQLRFRVTHHIPDGLMHHAAELGVGAGLGGEWLRIGSVKIFADGSLGARTAAMLEPYGDGHTGLLERDAASIVSLARRAAEAGLPLAIHAIGDRAIREALDGLEQSGTCIRRAPHRLEHVQHICEPDLARMASMGVVASVQPVHLCEDAHVVERCLPDRVGRAFAYGSMARHGLTLCFGSDAPVESFDPLDGVRAAVLRRDRVGRWPGGWQPGERITVSKALQAYTLGPAIALGRLWPEGRVAPGYHADMVALSHDITVDPDALEVCRADLTIVGGEVVFDRLGLAQ